MEMAPVIGPLVTSDHRTSEGGDLVCLWIPAAAALISLSFLPRPYTKEVSGILLVCYNKQSNQRDTKSQKN